MSSRRSSEALPHREGKRGNKETKTNGCGGVCVSVGFGGDRLFCISEEHCHCSQWREERCGCACVLLVLVGGDDDDEDDDYERSPRSIGDERYDAGQGRSRDGGRVVVVYVDVDVLVRRQR